MTDEEIEERIRALRDAVRMVDSYISPTSTDYEFFQRKKQEWEKELQELLAKSE